MPITTKVVCFSHLLKVDPDQTAPIGAVCSGSTLLTSILNLSVLLNNYLQQTTSADDIFRCIFFLAHHIEFSPKFFVQGGEGGGGGGRMTMSILPFLQTILIT